MVIQMLKDLGVTNLIVCGGNGSLAGAECLVREGGLKVVGVPCTIDNDLAATELALGFQSAIASIVWAVDHFKDTARSHRRVMVLETMGRASGELAQMAGIASGAEFVFVPEEPKLTEEQIRLIASRISADFRNGRTHTIVLVAEGVEFEPPSKEMPGAHVARILREVLEVAPHEDSDPEVEVRDNNLGHMQRGGRPDPQDAILAAQFADEAWDSINRSSCPGGIVVIQNGKPGLVGYEALKLSHNPSRHTRYSSLQRALSGW
jgi:6-phosphofructokinase 1